MNLYIMRHGEAEYQQDDGERVLTESGIEGVHKMAQYCKDMDVSAPQLWHSPVKRACQTAQIMHDTVMSDVEMNVENCIVPEGDVDMARDLIEACDDDLWIVSHLPFVDRLVSTLVFNREYDMIHFRPATIVALERIADAWYVSWCMHPGMVHKI